MVILSMSERSASREWDKENMRTVACRVRVEEAEQFKKLAGCMETTAHAMLAGYVRACLKQTEKAGPSVWPTLQAMTDENRRLRKENQTLRMKLEAAISRGDHAEELCRSLLNGDGEKGRKL